MLDPAQRLTRWWVEFLDILFPPACAGCGQAGEYLCPRCQAQVVPLEPPWCPRCGQPWRPEWGPPGAACPLCRAYPPAFAQARSYTAMTGVARAAIHALKYDGVVGLGPLLAEWLAWVVKREGWPVEAVVPVPLGAARLAERGYNQAAWLAYPLAQRLGVAYAPDALYRQRETASQVGLSAAERRANVAGAFRARGALPYRRVLLVDDVMTTGATLSAAATALRALPGVKEVWAVTVARAVLGDKGDNVPFSHSQR